MSHGRLTPTSSPHLKGSSTLPCIRNSLQKPAPSQKQSLPSKAVDTSAKILEHDSFAANSNSTSNMMSGTAPPPHPSWANTTTLHDIYITPNQQAHHRLSNPVSLPAEAAFYSNLTDPPLDPVHLTHMGFNSSTGEFTGLPKEWQQLLQKSSISKSEQEKDSQVVMGIVKFYQEGQGDTSVWDKMGTVPAPAPAPFAGDGLQHPYDLVGLVDAGMGGASPWFETVVSPPPCPNPVCSPAESISTSLLSSAPYPNDMLPIINNEHEHEHEHGHKDELEDEDKPEDMDNHKDDEQEKDKDDEQEQDKDDKDLEEEQEKDNEDMEEEQKQEQDKLEDEVEDELEDRRSSAVDKGKSIEWHPPTPPMSPIVTLSHCSRVEVLLPKWPYSLSKLRMFGTTDAMPSGIKNPLSIQASADNQEFEGRSGGHRRMTSVHKEIHQIVADSYMHAHPETSVSGSDYEETNAKQHDGHQHYAKGGHLTSDTEEEDDLLDQELADNIAADEMVVQPCTCQSSMEMMGRTASKLKRNGKPRRSKGKQRALPQVEHNESDLQTLDEGPEGCDEVKHLDELNSPNSDWKKIPGPLSAEAKSKIATFSEDIRRHAEHLACKFRKATCSVMLQAGLGVRPSWGVNHMNQFHIWYAAHHPKPDDKEKNLSNKDPSKARIPLITDEQNVPLFVLGQVATWLKKAKVPDSIVYGLSNDQETGDEEDQESHGAKHLREEEEMDDRELTYPLAEARARHSQHRQPSAHTLHQDHQPGPPLHSLRPPSPSAECSAKHPHPNGDDDILDIDMQEHPLPEVRTPSRAHSQAPRAASAPHQMLPQGQLDRPQAHHLPSQASALGPPI
ncbi:unnamed protein product [Somion occarium]|uniref:non-specific serine/threonine protein kinase n=1 Tax=Somion occarium TaxID=3059160 RepID=A0ABP1DPZ6_9APHY